MKRSLAVSAVVVLGICLLNENSLGQFKQDAEEKPKVTESIFRNPSSAGLFSWFNPNNFFMRQQLSMSFGSFGGRTGSVAQFTNSMFYKVSNPLDLRVDVSMLYSPYNSFGSENFNRLYISNAEVNYHPSRSFSIQLQYRENPRGYYSPYYNPFYGYYR